MNKVNKVIVVGGGVSGIAAAHYLKEQGVDTILLEKSAILGGRVGLDRLGDRDIELGGKNIGMHYTHFRSFASTLGFDDYEYFGLNSSRLCNGHLVTIDSTKKFSLLKSLAKTHSLVDLVRFGRYFLHIKDNDDRGFLDSPYFNKVSSKFGHRKLSDVFGSKFCSEILRPLVVRMNGAEPDETYIGNIGSNLRMLNDSYEQLHNGLNGLLNEFSKYCQVEFNSDVTQLYLENQKIIGLKIKKSDGKEIEMACDAVILAIPAKYTATLLRTCLPEVADTLDTVSYFPVGVIVAEYNKNIFSSKTRALIFDKNSSLSNAGAYGINDLNIVRYTFSGRSARKHLNNKYNFDTLLEKGEHELNKYFPVCRENRINYTARIFENGLCAYTQDHHKFLKKLEHGLANFRGLNITGDYIMGASIEACFRSSYSTVQKMVANNLGL